MLLVIHNLPSTTRYCDVKSLIKEKCGLTEMIVDNLVNEGKGKQVTVGLADDGDAALLVRKMNMIYVGTHQIHVEKMRNKMPSNQPYKATEPDSAHNQPYNNQFAQIQFPHYGGQPFHPQQNAQYPQMMQAPQQQPQVQPATNTPAPNFGLPFYMTAQTSNVGRGNPSMTQYSMQDNQQARPVGRNTNFDQQRSDRSSGRRSRSRSRERSPHRRSDRWESDSRSQGLRGRQRTPPRDRDRYNPVGLNEPTSYPPRSQYGSSKCDNTGYEKPSSRSDAMWERRSRFSGSGSRTFSSNPGNSTFSASNDNTYQNNDRGLQKGPSRRRDDGYSPSRERGRDSSPRYNSPFKRANDKKSTFEPVSKKLASNQHANFKNQPGFSGNSFSSNQPRPVHQNNQMFPSNRSLEPKQQPTFSNNRPQQQHQQSKFQNKLPHQPRFPNSWPRQPNQQSTFPKIRPQQQNYRAMQPNHRPNLQLNYEPKVGNAASISNTTEAQNVQSSTSTSQLKDLITKHNSWRSQAASNIANQIYTNLRIQKGGHKKSAVFIQLKASIRSRLDVITGDDLSMRPNVMMEKYRKTFKADDDALFYKAVLMKVGQSQQQVYKAEAVAAKAAEAASINLESDEEQEPTDTGNIPDVGARPTTTPATKPILEVNVEPDGERLPRHPFGNKSIESVKKRIEKEEVVNDLMYVLPPLLDQALQEELNTICDIYIREIKKPEDKEEKVILKHMQKFAVPEFRKILNLTVKKRILGVHTNLTVRVYCDPKYPNRDKLDTFLKTYGVISVKKSETKKKMYIATCSSYDGFDMLCALGTTQLDDTELKFKPLHITGPPVKNNKHKNKEANDEKEFDVNEDSSDHMSDEDIEDKNDIVESDNENDHIEEEVIDTTSQIDMKIEDLDYKQFEDNFKQTDFANDDFDFTADVEIKPDVTNDIANNTNSQKDNNTGNQKSNGKMDHQKVNEDKDNLENSTDNQKDNNTDNQNDKNEDSEKDNNTGNQKDKNEDNQMNNNPNVGVEDNDDIAEDDLEDF